MGLLPALSDCHRPEVCLPRLQRIEHGADEENTEEHDNSPVHRGNRHNRDGHWPEHPEPDEPGVSDRDGIDRDAPSAQTPLCLWKKMRRRDASVKDAGDTNTVGTHLSHSREGKDGVECIRRPKVDERDEDGECGREEDCVHWEPAVRVDLADPAGHWEATVSCERKGLSGGRCLVCDVAEHEQHELNHGEADCAIGASG